MKKICKGIQSLFKKLIKFIVKVFNFIFHSILWILQFAISIVIAVLVGFSIAIEWTKNNVLQRILERMWPFKQHDEYY